MDTIIISCMLIGAVKGLVTSGFMWNTPSNIRRVLIPLIDLGCGIYLFLYIIVWPYIQQHRKKYLPPDKKAMRLYWICLSMFFGIFIVDLILRLLEGSAVDGLFFTVEFYTFAMHIFIGIASLCWFRRLSISGAVGAFRVCLSILFFVLSCVAGVQVVNLVYRELPYLSVLWREFWHWTGANLIEANITWVSLGATFLAGCLIVISWAKEIPCPNWNPFTAHELTISESIPFCGIALWYLTIWATSNQSTYLAALSCFLLLCISVMASVRCYQLQDDKSIRVRIAEKLNWEQVFHKCMETGIISKDNAIIENIYYKSEPADKKNDRISGNSIEFCSFIEKIRRITSHMISQMAQGSSYQQPECMIELIDYLYTLTPPDSDYQTIGLLFGLGCVPLQYSHKEWQYVNVFINTLHNRMFESTNIFHNYIAVGMLVGFANLSYYEPRNKYQVSQSQSNGNDMRSRMLTQVISLKMKYESVTDKPDLGLVSVLLLAMGGRHENCENAKMRLAIPEETKNIENRLIQSIFEKIFVEEYNEHQ